jgi:DNA-directed RNA polymerase subunit N (RpoN/RPB10)
MATDCIPQVTFEFDKVVVAKFDAEYTSSDGGAVLVKALDQELGVTEAVASCLQDGRQRGKVQHEVLELVRQRIFGLVCGYSDCNDAARLADDAIHKWLLDRDPLGGAALASQSTLSRFENAVGPRALTSLGHALADLVIGQHCARRRGRARRITIDLDPTDDPTHGQQEFAFFHGHYDTWCYLPLLGFVTFDDEAEQYLVLALLRPGNSPAKRGAIGRLRTLFRKLRAAFPGACLRVRLDGGFAGEDLLAFLEAEGVEYLVAMGSNRRLDKRVRRLMGKARMQSKASGETEHEFGETRYAARKWSHTRRIIMKAEVVRHPGRAPKNNPRFVVTNLAQTPAHVYRLYRERGDVENRIKELKDGLALDRLSCSRFLGNQFRVLLTAAAYILMQALRLHAAGTACATAQVMTLRERLLKVAVWVERSVRRIVLHFPTAFPWRPTWRHVACALGASP